jgi:hypothetical protein
LIFFAAAIVGSSRAIAITPRTNCFIVSIPLS